MILLKKLEVLPGEQSFLEPSLVARKMKRDYALGMRKRQSMKHHGINDPKDNDIDTDSNSQDQHGCQ